VVVGHSFGGVVALHLAARPGVRAVVGLGIKVVWTDDELQRGAALAAREPARFDSRGAAVARHLRLAGLDGLVHPDSPVAQAGVVEEDGRFRPALDPRAFGVGEPGVGALVAASPVPVVLARGERDAMVSTEQLAALVDGPVVLAGLGHNAHAEDPGAVVRLISGAATAPR
jgi:pimeloyl-ACP methyl ester carboxylesterase